MGEVRDEDGGGGRGVKEEKDQLQKDRCWGGREAAADLLVPCHHATFDFLVGALLDLLPEAEPDMGGHGGLAQPLSAKQQSEVPQAPHPQPFGPPSVPNVGSEPRCLHPVGGEGNEYVLHEAREDEIHRLRPDVEGTLAGRAHVRWTVLSQPLT